MISFPLIVFVRKFFKHFCKNKEQTTAHNTAQGQSTNVFKSIKDGNQSGEDEGLTGVMSKLVSQQSSPNVDIDVFHGNLLDFNCLMSLFEEM